MSDVRGAYLLESDLSGLGVSVRVAGETVTAWVLFVLIETSVLIPRGIYSDSYEGRVRCYQDAAEMKSYLPQATEVACKFVRLEVTEPTQKPLLP